MKALSDHYYLRATRASEAPRIIGHELFTGEAVENTVLIFLKKIRSDAVLQNL